MFQESLPSGPPGADNTLNTIPTKSIAPYKIIGGINEPGLGLLAWWDSPEQPEDDDNEEKLDD